MEGYRPGHNLRLGTRTELTLTWEKAACVLCVRGAYTMRVVCEKNEPSLPVEPGKW